MPQENMPEPQGPTIHSAPPPHARDDDDDEVFERDEGEGDEPGVDWAELDYRIRSQVVANPLLALGAAVATGYLIGRLFRR